MIEITNLTHKYGQDEPPVLGDITLKVDQGDYIALIGSNGSGKTTLLKHLNALLLPTSGDVSINGRSVHQSKNLREIRRQVGMIFQNPDNQIVGMTVGEDVAFGPGNLGLPPSEVRNRVDHALAQVGLTGLEQRIPHSLSGGQKQLLAMAGILAMEPRIIVLDEPTASLDQSGKQTIMALLKALNRQALTIIHVTQDISEAAQAKRVLVLDHGQVAADGPPAEILTRVEWLKSLGLAPDPLTELMGILRQRGEKIDTAVFDLEHAVLAVVALLDGIRLTSSDTLPEKVEQ